MQNENENRSMSVESVGVPNDAYEIESRLCDPIGSDLYLYRMKLGLSPSGSPQTMLTCKSLVLYEYRGERLIELSISWFNPKCPSG